MTSKYKIQLNSRVCAKIGAEGKPMQEAYILTKYLCSLVKHPILFNFKANIQAYRAAISYTEVRFRRALKYAESYGMVKLEGDHLRLAGRSWEKRFTGRNKVKYIEVDPKDIKNYFHISRIIYHIKKQEIALKLKKRSVAKNGGCSGEHSLDYAMPCQFKEVNTEITLSCRAAAKLFNCSISHAYKITQQLSAYGLDLQLNKVELNYGQFMYYKQNRSVNLRVDRDNGKLWYMKARLVNVSSFYKN